MNINQKIGDKLKNARLRKKLSREQIARRIKVSQQTIEKYEKGTINISVMQLTKLSDILDITIIEIFS